MKISTKGRYGMRALLDIALHQDEAPILLKDIAERQQISLSYLEHLVATLVQGGILHSVRGVGGGIYLARPPREIKLSEVVRLLEGSLALVDCVDDPRRCLRSESCVTRDVWSEVKTAMDSVLEVTSLQDLVERQKEKEEPAYAMYYI